MLKISNALRSSRAAIDLASIMVGVIIIGLIGGVIAATVFAVIPWSQDKAAKHQLESIHTAENAYYGLSADPSYMLLGNTVQRNTFTNSDLLARNNLLIEGPTYCAVMTPDGQDYNAYSKSATGRIWTASNKAKTPVVTTTSPCAFGNSTNPGTTDPGTVDPGTTNPGTTEPVVTPPATSGRVAMTLNCPAGVTTMQLPLYFPVGTTTWSDGKTEVYHPDAYVTDTTGARYFNNNESVTRTVTPGVTYTAVFEGTVRELYGNHVTAASASCLRSVDEWGTGAGIKKVAGAFRNATNLTSVPTAFLPGVTSMNDLFYGASSFNQNLSSWDTSAVTEMNGTFNRTNYNQPLSSWNTSKVYNFSDMFYMNKSFNQPIGNWDTSSAKDMGFMFADTNFTQDITGWNTAKVEDMGSMFQNTDFNQDISGWNVTAVKSYNAMFAGTTSFNQPIGKWVVTNGTDFSGMFGQAKAFNQPLNWDMRNATNLSFMFSNNNVFNQDISGWTTFNVVNMQSMFEHATVFKQNLSNWNVQKVSSRVGFSNGNPMIPAELPRFR